MKVDKILKLIEIVEPYTSIVVAGIVLCEYISLRKDIDAIYNAVDAYRYR